MPSQDHTQDSDPVEKAPRETESGEAVRLLRAAGKKITAETVAAVELGRASMRTAGDPDGLIRRLADMLERESNTDSADEVLCEAGAFLDGRTPPDPSPAHCKHHKEGLGLCMHCYPPPGHVWDDEQECVVPAPGRDLFGRLTRPPVEELGPTLPRHVTWADHIALLNGLRSELDEARANLAEASRLWDGPETADWIAGVRKEAPHQVARWGLSHDDGKEPEDWLWLLGFLATKAVQSARAGDVDKALHHTISSGAMLLNWHARLLGIASQFRPGTEAPFTVPEDPSRCGVVLYPYKKPCWLTPGHEGEHDFLGTTTDPARGE